MVGCTRLQITTGQSRLTGPQGRQDETWGWHRAEGVLTFSPICPIMRSPSERALTSCCVPGTALGIACEFLSLQDLQTSLFPIDEVIYFSDHEPKCPLLSSEWGGAPDS